MNKHYLFLPIVFIIIIITTLLGLNSQAQEVRSKQIHFDHAAASLENTFEIPEESNKGERITSDQMVEFVELNVDKSKKQQLIFIGNSGDDLTIEREGEVIFINKEHGIEQLDSDMHLEYTKDGKQAIVIQTKIILEEFNSAEIEGLQSTSAIKTDNVSDFEYVRFYPNPTKSDLNISFKLDEPANTNVKITNMLGQIMFEENLLNFNGTYNKIVDVSDFAKGTYILLIQQGKRNISKKIIVE